MTDETKPDEDQNEDTVLDEMTDSDVSNEERVSDEDEALEVELDTPEEPNSEPASTVIQKRSGLPILIGGGLAAVLGFAVAQVVPDGWPIAAANDEEIETQLEAQSQEIDTLKGSLDELTSALAAKLDTSKFDTDLQALTQSAKQSSALHNDGITANQENLSKFAVRLSDLEKRPIAEGADPSGAVAAYERELTELKATLDAQKAELEATAREAEAKVAEAKSQAENLQAGAEATANAALLRVGTSNIATALENGGSFQAALLDVAQATGQEPSADLTAASVSGVETLVDLRKSFPAAARAALSVSGLSMDDEGTAFDRLSSFVRSQTGARSLSPRDGTDADAILSRAEASLVDGDLSAALDELATLQQPAQEKMATWIQSATYRLDTITAVNAFTDATSNK